MRESDDITLSHADEVRVCDRDALLDLDCGSFEQYEPQQTRIIDSIHYDPQKEYLVFRMKGTYYHRCGVPQQVVDDWVEAEGTVHHYRRTIKPHFTCAKDVPDYE